MNGKQLINTLKEQLDIPTDDALAKRLGIKPGKVSNWRTQSTDLTPKQLSNTIAKALSRSAESALMSSIKPIVEYYPIDLGKGAGGERAKLFVPQSKEVQRKQLKKCLQETKGIYLLYDSQGKALYVGKTADQNLWVEMTTALNREQKIHMVYHGASNKEFVPAHEKNRPIRKEPKRLYELARYFSAYEVEPDLIRSAEALLVRAFWNSLLNVQRPSFPQLG